MRTNIPYRIIRAIRAYSPWACETVQVVVECRRLANGRIVSSLTVRYKGFAIACYDSETGTLSIIRCHNFDGMAAARINSVLRAFKLDERLAYHKGECLILTNDANVPMEPYDVFNLYVPIDNRPVVPYYGLQLTDN